jgi:outer membrane protein OmpA-like peptidoglycan-associated protein
MQVNSLKWYLMVMRIPYVRVSGKLLNRSTGQIIPASANPTIWIDNATSDSVKFDSRTGSYSMNISHGQKYSLLGKANKHESGPAILDLTNVEEFQEINFDLYLETEKMVTVTGLVLDKNSGKGFVPASKVNVIFGGLSAIPATMDALTSRVEIHLAPGSSYTISASAPNCVPVYDAIDLTNSSRGATITRDLTLATIEVGQAVRLNNIFFESGKAVLKKESFPELDRVYDFLKQNESIKVEIAGHTAMSAMPPSTRASPKRTEAVAAYVIKKGIVKDRLQSEGYGMTKPVTSNATKEGKAQNRRVEFMVLGK